MQNIDLKDLFKSDEEFERELESLNKEILKYTEFENHLYDSADKMYEFLKFNFDISKRYERLYNYASINKDLDTSVSKYQDYEMKVENFGNKLGELTNFIDPELLSHEYSDFEKMMEQKPELKEYELSLKETFRTKKCVKSKEEETIITYLTENMGKANEIADYLLDTDLKYGKIKDENGKEIELTESNYSVYLESKDRRVRKDAFNAMYNTIESHKNTFASILGMQFSNANKYAKVRGFDSARDYSLFRNEIDSKVYDNLVKGVSNNLNRFYDYYDYKKTLLEVDEMHLYDTYANSSKSYNKKYTFEEAKDLIIKALAPLGEKYITDLKRAFDEHWIDFEVREGKRGGGYCTCSYLAHPYVVINFEGTYDDVSTLAHELGHAMNFLYSMQNNPYQYYENPIFTAEVASQVNELLLADYIYKNSNDNEEKKYILDQNLSRFKATIVRQTMFAEFEALMHEKENQGIPLTRDEITNSYLELNKKYYGPNIVVDDLIKYECFRIPHFYYDFYVYQYATGYASAMKISKAILDKEPNALEAYLNFLSLGSTKDPVSLLKDGGVDINSEKIYDEVFDTFQKELKLFKTK